MQPERLRASYVKLIELYTEVAMDSKWKEERAGFIAGEIGGAVIDLILAGMVINRNNIIIMARTSLSTRRRIDLSKPIINQNRCCKNGVTIDFVPEIWQVAAKWQQGGSIVFLRP
ncbi:Uncharacterised protein [Yersinia thracica]|uniref:Uncharacterized protein n=2 Tax=Yersinia thracica TaxID=2890319 RepID=A0A0T9P376_9GAMM|nr:Uncharacterised protein [Yersinia thracica]